MRYDDFPKNFFLIDMVDKRQREKDKYEMCAASNKPNMYLRLTQLLLSHLQSELLQGLSPRPLRPQVQEHRALGYLALI